MKSTDALLSVGGLYNKDIKFESEVSFMSSNQAKEIAKNYFEAMANRDVEKIISLAADHITTSSPLGKLEGIQSFRNFQVGFAKMINQLTLLAAFGDDEKGVIIYEMDTLPVKYAVAAEYIIVKDGKIVSTEVIYDGSPFTAYAATQSKL